MFPPYVGMNRRSTFIDSSILSVFPVCGDESELELMQFLLSQCFPRTWG